METVVCIVAFRDTRFGRAVLLVRKENLWMFPGGKVETGESEEQCLVRELEVEELPGIKLKIGVRYCEMLSRRARKGDVIRFVAYLGDIRGVIVPDAELTGARWIVPGLNFRKNEFCEVVETVPRIIATLKQDGLL